MARTAMTPAREKLSLAASLARFSADQLLTLLRGRPDLLDPPPRDLAGLAVRASHWSSVNACLVTLNRGLLQLLDALCLLPQPTTVAAVVDILNIGVDPGELDAALCRLRDLGLVLWRGDQLQVHPQLEQLRYPAGLGPPAGALLEAQQSSAVTAMAKRLGVPAGRTKSETVASLITALRDRDVVVGALAGAPQGTQSVLQSMVQHPVQSVPWGTYGVAANTPLGWLAARGLVVATDWSNFVMPREVGLALRGGRPFPEFRLRAPAAEWRPVDLVAADRAGVEAAQRLVADIAAILDSWQDVPPKLLKAGGIGVRDLRRAATLIGRSETATARVIDLAAAAGLAGWDSEAAVALPRPGYDDWLQHDIARRWVAVAGAWLDVELHINLAGATGTNGKPIPPLLSRWPEIPARQRRRLVLNVLLDAEVGQAPASDLTTRVVWDAPAIWSDGPASPTTMAAWVEQEADMLGIAALGTLTTVGRAVVAGAVEEAVAELARHSPKITSQVIIQADLTAVAAGPLATAVRSSFESMADLESSGSATVYRFTEPSLRRAYDAGWTAEAIVGFLDAHATKGVPQPLNYLVEDIGRRHGRVRAGAASCYLRADDPSLLTEIVLARRHAKLGLRQLAPTVLVSTADPGTVVDTLRAGGYLPAEENSTGDLLIRRREVLRAPGGLGPPASQGGRRPDLAGYGEIRAGGFPSDADIQALVRQLRAPRAKAGASPPPLRLVNGTGSPRQPPPPAPFSPLDLFSQAPARPTEIVYDRSDIEILLEAAHRYEWWLRLEYRGQRGPSRQLTATVFEIDDDHVTVGTMPGYGTRKMAISRVSWVRVMTEAEEAAL